MFQYTSQVWTLNTGNGSLIYSPITHIISFFITTLAMNSSWTLWWILSMVLPNQSLTLCPCQRSAPIPFPLSLIVSGLSIPSLDCKHGGKQTALPIQPTSHSHCPTWTQTSPLYHNPLFCQQCLWCTHCFHSVTIICCQLITPETTFSSLDWGVLLLSVS